MKLLDLVHNNFENLGFAEWISGQGLLINNKEVPTRGGVYVLTDRDGRVQKVGQSRNLKQRFQGYRGDDKTLEKNLNKDLTNNTRTIDATAARIRRAMTDNNLDGLFVHIFVVQDEKTEVLGRTVYRPSFDPAVVEAMLQSDARMENQPLWVGDK